MEHDLTEEQEKDLRQAFWDIFGDSIGVYQAINDLTKALEALKFDMNLERYEEAAKRGYAEISTSFVFLQRCLAGVQAFTFRRDTIIQSVARAKGIAFEVAEPIVMKVWESIKKEPPSHD